MTKLCLFPDNLDSVTNPTQTTRQTAIAFFTQFKRLGKNTGKITFYATEKKLSDKIKVIF